MKKTPKYVFYDGDTEKVIAIDKGKNNGEPPWTAKLGLSDDIEFDDDSFDSLDTETLHALALEQKASDIYNKKIAIHPLAAKQKDGSLRTIAFIGLDETIMDKGDTDEIGIIFDHLVRSVRRIESVLTIRKEIK